MEKNKDGRWRTLPVSSEGVVSYLASPHWSFLLQIHHWGPLLVHVETIQQQYVET